MEQNFTQNNALIVYCQNYDIDQKTLMAQFKLINIAEALSTEEAPLLLNREDERGNQVNGETPTTVEWSKEKTEAAQATILFS